MSTVKDFRVLLFELAETLHKNDIEGIIYIEQLPAEFQEQSALKVLLKLEMLGKIEAANPSTLEDVFRNIRRMDLVKKVKEFSKSQKKSKKNMCSPKRMEDLELSLRANLEVTVLQMRLIHDQLKQLQKTAELLAAPSYTEIEALISGMKGKSEEVDKMLSQVKDLLVRNDDRFSESIESENNFQPSVVCRRKSSFDKELQQSLQARTHTRSTPKDHETSPKSSSEPSPNRREAIKAIPEAESEYAEVRRRSQLCIKDTDGSLFGKFSSSPPNKEDSSSYGGSSSTLVTGALDKFAGSKKKPMVPPKLQKTKCKEFHVADEEDDNTAGTTGDSGFADATPFLRIPLRSSRLPSPLPSPSNSDDDTTLPSIHDTSLSSTADTLTPESSPPGYYKAICKDQVEGASYYKVINRESQFQKWQDISKRDTPRRIDSKVYENSSSHHTF